MESETPLFIVSKEEIKKRIIQLKKISDILYYSYKTNPFIGKIIIKEYNDVGLSLNHPNSLKDLRKDILQKSIYYVQSEDIETLRNLEKKGIKRIIVDNENDLKKILHLKNIEEIYIRVKYREHTFYTGKYFVFGISWKKIEEIIRKYSLHKKYTLGLHFHKKTQNVGEWYLFEDFFNMFSENFLKKYNISFINIGGGIPWKYINSSPNIENIFNSILKFKKELNKHNISLVIEPGRYIAAPSVRLITKIINIYDNVAIVNSSIYNAYMDTYLLHHRLPILEENKEGKYKYLIKGNTLDSLDIFRYSASFPSPLKEGEKITFLNVGAYNFHCNFSFLSPIPYKILKNFNN